MFEVKTYQLPPTALIPNSPQPLLHYRGLFSTNSKHHSLDNPRDGVDHSNGNDSNYENGGEGENGQCSPVHVHDTLRSNDWQMHWIYRYGRTQAAHYHRRVHECMVVLSGQATIRFGVADLPTDPTEPTHGNMNAREQGGLELSARAGDVFIVPAGMAHKTFDTRPEAEFALLTPGDGHIAPLAKTKEQVKRSDTMAAIAGAEGSAKSNDGAGKEDVNGEHRSDQLRDALSRLSLDGFTMMGAYPMNAADWDFAHGGEDEGQYELVWAVAKPGLDPVLGSAGEGLCGQWKTVLPVMHQS